MDDDTKVKIISLIVLGTIGVSLIASGRDSALLTGIISAITGLSGYIYGVHSANEHETSD